ncbi:MAG: ABC transporter substrate-binding protein [Blastocatellia bacterium]|nr:ABC transporter substrate-binding protein [Blastocatellia bacterium]
MVSKSAGPRTFNRLLSFDDQTTTINNCLMGALIRINRQTQQPEPELAESWKNSPDGKTLLFRLRPNIKYSDGATLSADDVIFTFQIINDPKISTALSGQFEIGRKRVEVRKVDLFTVSFTFPVAYAAAVRLFDGVPILPRHKLESIHREGRFEQAWTLATPPDQIVGIGPFKLKSYVPGQRVVLVRNENYWKTDAAGRRLPYLDEIVFNIDPDRNTQLLKFQRGETDLLSPLNADDAAALAPLEQQGKVRITNLGPSLIREILWFNLNSGKPGVDPVKLSWFQNTGFRRAISHAIDRHAIANLAFSGKAAPQWGFLSAGDKLWHNPKVALYPHDSARALALLAASGFRYQPDKNTLLDSQGHPVSFTLTTNAGNALRQKMASLIQEDLAHIGIKVTLAFLESRALLSRIDEGASYDACLLAVVSGDADPTSHMNILASHGSNHWWHPRQSRPATPWEDRIDQLMNRQMITLAHGARKKLFDEVQAIMADQQPFVFLASRHLLIAAKPDIGNLKPALLPDFVLWNPEELYRK